MNIFRKGDDGKSLIVGIRHEGSLAQLLRDFLQAYKDRTEALKGQPPIGETAIKQDLQAIIEMLKPQAPVPADLRLVKEELSLIHELVVSMAANSEKAEELSERIRKQVEALKSATPKSE